MLIFKNLISIKALFKRSSKVIVIIACLWLHMELWTLTQLLHGRWQVHLNIVMTAPFVMWWCSWVEFTIPSRATEGWSFWPSWLQSHLNIHVITQKVCIINPLRMRNVQEFLTEFDCAITWCRITNTSTSSGKISILFKTDTFLHYLESLK